MFKIFLIESHSAAYCIILEAEHKILIACMMHMVIIIIIVLSNLSWLVRHKRE